MLPMVQNEFTLNCRVQSVARASSPTSLDLVPATTPESDVDDLVLSFFDIDVGAQRIENCDLQLGDTWRGIQSKMSVTAPVKKIRKKSDSKPQSQINKCHNEKRRRELENETINQLEELLGSCLAEVKQPDKNGIVREATKKIEEILRRRRECPADCPSRCLALAPVQGGEITSTQANPTHYSEISSLIEALKYYTTKLGLILLEINSNGLIVCVTDNIQDLVYKSKNELYNKSIFSLVHVNDHSKIKPLFRNLHPTVQQFGVSTTEIERFQVIQTRLIIQDSNGSSAPRVVEAVIHVARVRTEHGGSVMCVVRSTSEPTTPIANLAITEAPQHKHDNIVFRLDRNLNILSCDLSGVDGSASTTLSLVGARYLDLVESGDRERIAAHFHDVPSQPAPPNSSDAFRLRIAPNKPWLRVSATSRLFHAKPTSGEPDFIMSTHSVLTDEDSQPDGDAALASDPDADDKFRPPDGLPDPPFSINDFDYDPWSNSFQMADMDEAKESKPNSPCAPLTPRTPLTPLTPLTPSEEPNRLRSLLSQKSGESSAPNNRLLKDLLKQEDEEASSSETSAPHTPHTPHTPSSALSPLHMPRTHATHNNSDMLLKILNDKSDEDAEERRCGESSRAPSQPSALLTQLLSNSNGPNVRTDATDNYLKRKLEDAKPTPNKRLTPDSRAAPRPPPALVTSTAPTTMSELCAKNQILVSLLAKQQATPTPLTQPRTFAPRLRHATPRHDAPRHDTPRHDVRTTNGDHSQLHMALSGNRHFAPTPAPAYPHHLYNNHTTANRANESTGDQALSDILDEVIENLPDRPADVVPLMGLENRQIRPEYPGMNEENAMINAIRQSLIQCEKASKSSVPSSPGPPAYPAQSPQGMSGLFGTGDEALRQRQLNEQHRARLLQMQRSQQMLVSPEAAETPQSDLGSTINALVSATPPNVSLTRTDYHQLYHPSSQMGSTYGTNKISSQQNPMLSRQLSQSSSASYSLSSPAASLHTPTTPHQPYHRPPRPPLVSGYYEESAGYGGGEYSRRMPITHDANTSGAGGSSSGGGTSEYVRNELRAVVGARSSRPEIHPQMQQELDPLLVFDIPTPGGESATGRAPSTTVSWGAQPTTSNTTAAAGLGSAAADDASPPRESSGASSLLQKLLSQ